MLLVWCRSSDDVHRVCAESGERRREKHRSLSTSQQQHRPAAEAYRRQTNISRGLWPGAWRPGSFYNTPRHEDKQAGIIRVRRFWSSAVGFLWLPSHLRKQTMVPRRETLTEALQGYFQHSFLLSWSRWFQWQMLQYESLLIPCCLLEFVYLGYNWWRLKFLN